MTLTRWSPVSDLATLDISRLNQVFEAALGGDRASRGGWVPAVDILETANKDVVVKIELPEMKREDITITFENNVLTVEGERKLESDKDAGKYHRVERGHGKFRRSFTAPTSIDAGRVEASYRDGVLTVTLPRREETRPRQIPVNG